MKLNMVSQAAFDLSPEMLQAINSRANNLYGLQVLVLKTEP